MSEIETLIAALKQAVRRRHGVVTPSATSIPTQTTEARAQAFMYILKRSWLTQRQIEMAMEFGFAAAKQEGK